MLRRNVMCITFLLRAFGTVRIRHNRNMTKIKPTAHDFIEWVDEIDSTNSELLRRAAAGAAHAPQALVAARQTRGADRGQQRNATLAGDYSAHAERLDWT